MNRTNKNYYKLKYRYSAQKTDTMIHVKLSAAISTSSKVQWSMSYFLVYSDRILHTQNFTDSRTSNVAYAAAVYLRVLSSSGEVTVTLLAVKSRVAPLTPVTIPRLELSAAVFLARLLEFVRESLNSSISSCTCWTNSTIVLAWLRQHPSH